MTNVSLEAFYLKTIHLQVYICLYNIIQPACCFSLLCYSKEIISLLPEFVQMELK